ncbi:MAG: DUF4258 domain-containing protein [Rubrobacter sp.]
MRFEKIKLSNHARKRMRQRNIPRNQILRTLNEPERVYPSKGKMVAERSTEAGNVIQVVYVERAGDYGEDAFVVSLVRRSGDVE